MNMIKKYITLLLIITSGIISSQEKNKVHIDNYINEKTSLKSNQYLIKSSVETNPNYDVYYVQQRYNDLEIHNAISTMSIKDGEVRSFTNRFVNESLGKTSEIEPKIDSYSAIEKGLNELNITTFKNSPNGWTHTNPYNIEAKLIYIIKDDKLKLAWKSKPLDKII